MISVKLDIDQIDLVIIEIHFPLAENYFVDLKMDLAAHKTIDKKIL
jgi:hypothetical protein